MAQIDCIFCKIIKGEIPCIKVYEDNNTMAFLDANPAARGHTLVVHKKHYETIEKMDEKSLNELMSSVKKLASVMLNISEGCNVIQNNKRVAGQIVDHMHFHVVPRINGDGINWNRPNIKLNSNDLEEISKKIKSLLKA